MEYIVETTKSVEQAAGDFEAAVENNGFGILHVYDLKQTLKKKGFDLPDECRIYEVCNPQQAINVLEHDMKMNMALPCRVSIYQQGGETRIGMIRPTALLELLDDSGELGDVATEVESTMIRMMQEAR